MQLYDVQQLDGDARYVLETCLKPTSLRHHGNRPRQNHAYETQ